MQSCKYPQLRYDINNDVTTKQIVRYTVPVQYNLLQKSR